MRQSPSGPFVEQPSPPDATLPGSMLLFRGIPFDGEQGGFQLWAPYLLGVYGYKHLPANAPWSVPSEVFDPLIYLGEPSYYSLEAICTLSPGGLQDVEGLNYRGYIGNNFPAPAFDTQDPVEKECVISPAPDTLTEGTLQVSSAARVQLVVSNLCFLNTNDVVSLHLATNGDFSFAVQSLQLLATRLNLPVPV